MDLVRIPWADMLKNEIPAQQEGCHTLATATQGTVKKIAASIQTNQSSFWFNILLSVFT